MKPEIQFAGTRTDKPASKNLLARAMKHPFFAWAGLRPLIAQHTEAEHRALEKYARGRKNIVEIGVAEGASAMAMRSAMRPEGTLYLVDPFHLSRLPMLNFLRRAAHRAVPSTEGPKVVWVEAFSHDAARSWNQPIDLLLIDGDHREEAVEEDWKDWTPYVGANAVVIFHDARVFPGGWTFDDYGPVKFVNRMFRWASSREWVIREEVDSLVILGRER